jgi:flagellar operon protein
MNRVFPNSALPIDPGIGRTGQVDNRSSSTSGPDRSQSSGFTELLQRELGRQQPLKLSAHAQQRLSARNITLGRDAMQRLEQAVARAEQKGAKDALLMMPGNTRGEDLAFVVSVTNRTVITAMDGEHITDNVFTNIDSAVFVQ